MCGTILWVGEQDDSTTLQSINSMHWRPSFQRRRIEIRGRIVKSMLSNCSEMLILGTYWKTCYSMVSEQTCTINHKMDQSLWQTIISFDLLHSSYMWTQTVLSCGKHFQTMQIGIVSRLRFGRRSWGFEIYVRWNVMRFWEVIHLFQSVGCVRNKLQFRTVQQESDIISLDARLRLDGKPTLDLWDLIVAVLHGNTYQSNQERGKMCTNIRAAPHKLQKQKKSHGMIDVLDNVDFISSNVNSYCQEAVLCVFEGNEAVIKMIIKGRSPTMRHVSITRRVALDWLFDRISLDPKIEIKYIGTKNQLEDILKKRKFHTWWMESSFVFVQHLSFQFYQLSWRDVEKNARRCRWRKSHRKI